MRLVANVPFNDLTAAKQAFAEHEERVQDAEEVVMDTMLSAWGRISTLRDPAALRPWLPIAAGAAG